MRKLKNLPQVTDENVRQKCEKPNGRCAEIAHGDGVCSESGLCAGLWKLKMKVSGTA